MAKQQDNKRKGKSFDKGKKSKVSKVALHIGFDVLNS